MGLTSFFKKPKQIFNKLFNRTKSVKQVETQKPHDYQPLRVINFKKAKHPLHKYHRGNFAPVKPFK